MKRNLLWMAALLSLPAAASAQSSGGTNGSPGSTGVNTGLSGFGSPGVIGGVGPGPGSSLEGPDTEGVLGNSGFAQPGETAPAFAVPATPNTPAPTGAQLMPPANAPAGVPAPTPGLPAPGTPAPLPGVPSQQNPTGIEP